MTTQEAKNDILKTGIFIAEELQQIESKNKPFPIFQSWEFYNIFYLTNADLYFLDDETFNNIESTADQEHDTPKGKIYCFK